MSYNIDRISGSKTIEVFKDFKEYRVSPGCRGICERSDLTTVPKRTKGFTCQEEGIKRCKRCEVHYKPQVGLRCPCCNQLLGTRYRSKQNRAYREKLIASKQQTIQETQKEEKSDIQE